MLTTDERIRSIGKFKLRALNSPEELNQEAKTILSFLQKIEGVKVEKYLIPSIEALRGHKLKDKANGKRHFSYFVLKPVGPRCNLRCSYCYHGAIEKFKFKRYSYLKENTVMDEALLERITQQAANFLYGKVEFDWHGGEPLLAGIDFYRRAVRIQKRYIHEGIEIKNCIQTNATLINDEWIRFFKENDFNIGLSLDGTKTNHNLHRAYASGRGSYDDVIKSLKKLKKAGIKFGSICVISPLHLKHANRLIESFIDAGISSVKIHPSNHPDLVLSSKEYADYIIEIFESWLSDYGTKISVSLFTDIFHVLLGLQLPICHGKCGQVLLSFEPNGDVWLCDWPFGSEEYRFGNILEMDLESIFNSDNYFNFLKTRTKVYEGCSTCQWYAFCRGGCIYFRTFKTGKIENGDYDCTGMKKIFEYVTNRFDKILEENGKENTISCKRVPVEI